jgi:hypothetical protein
MDPYHIENFRPYVSSSHSLHWRSKVFYNKVIILAAYTISHAISLLEKPTHQLFTRIRNFRYDTAIYLHISGLYTREIS